MIKFVILLLSAPGSSSTFIEIARYNTISECVIASEYIEENQYSVNGSWEGLTLCIPVIGEPL